MTDPVLAPSFRELLNRISGDVRLLASQTLTLARVEVSTSASALARSALGLFASLCVGAAGAVVLAVALVLILMALGLPAWAATTIVGVVLAASGAMAARHFVGTARGVDLGMKETRDSLRETMEWLKLQAGL